MEEKFTRLEWLKHYSEHIENIIDSEPFLSMVCLSVGIEFLGKLHCDDKATSNYSGKQNFESALTHFESLKKYSNQELYKLVRCGLAHSISIEEGIVVTTAEESSLSSTPIKLNVKQFFKDFNNAIADAEKSAKTSDVMSNDYVSVIDGLATGKTTTISVLINDKNE